MYRPFRGLRRILLGLFVLVTACGQPTSSFGDVANKPQEHTGDHAQPASGSGGALQPVLATSELVVGRNRVAL